METDSDLLRLTFMHSFNADITKIKLDDVDDSPRLVKISDLSQLTRNGEEIEKGDPLKEFEADISLVRTPDRLSRECDRHWLSHKI